MWSHKIPEANPSDIKNQNSIIVNSKFVPVNKVSVKTLKSASLNFNNTLDFKKMAKNYFTYFVIHIDKQA